MSKDGFHAVSDNHGLLSEETNGRIGDKSAYQNNENIFENASENSFFDFDLLTVKM
jgi:hypothetical protein